MKIISSKQFAKHLKNCPTDIQKKFVVVYDQLIAAKKLQDIKGAKKLIGYTKFYRIRIGHFRLGLELLEENQIELLALLHRKEIYRFFP
jgi:mRNA interferase RelE/StbE